MYSTSFDAILARSGQTRCHIPIWVEMSYDEADPLAFSMVFSAQGDPGNPWKVARDLLVDAMACDTPTGYGDVRFRRDPLAGHLAVCVRSPDGHADVKLPLPEVQEFLDASQADAADAVAFIPEMLDDFLKEVFDDQ